MTTPPPLVLSTKTQAMRDDIKEGLRTEIGWQEQKEGAGWAMVAVWAAG